METQPYDKDRFIEALLAIRKLTDSEPETFEPEIERLCAGCGVAVVFVPEVPGTRAYGATRWITPTKAILQLSLRGKAEDLLWFTFFHEAAHILKHGKRDVFIEAPDGTGRRGVEEEGGGSKHLCRRLPHPKAAFRDFTQRGVFSEAQIRAFARELGLHRASSWDACSTTNSFPSIATTG